MAKAKKRVKMGSGRAEAARRRHAFVESYIANGGNGLRAAVAAGFSPATAGQTAFKLLKHAQVRLLLEQRQAELAQKFELNTEGVLRSLSQALYFDPRKLYNPDDSLKRVVDLDDDTAMALAGLEVVEMAQGGMSIGEDGPGYVPMFTKKVKWLDKNTARDQALKVFGRYKADSTPPDDPLVAATERAAKGMESLSAKFKAVLAAHGAKT